VSAPKIPVDERLWPNTSGKGFLDCWEWQGGVSHNGYGYIKCDGRQQRTHRVAWELVNGPIPDGLQIDHLCRNRRCCNPAHLEPVTCRENLMRGETLAAVNVATTHCPAGHPYDESNTRHTSSGRICRECARTRHRAYMKRRRSTALKQKAEDNASR